MWTLCNSLNNEMTFCSSLFSDNVQSLLYEEVPVRLKRNISEKKKMLVRRAELWELMHLGRLLIRTLHLSESQLQLVFTVSKWNQKRKGNLSNFHRDAKRCIHACEPKYLKEQSLFKPGQVVTFKVRVNFSISWTPSFSGDTFPD